MPAGCKVPHCGKNDGLDFDLLEHALQSHSLNIIRPQPSTLRPCLVPHIALPASTVTMPGPERRVTEPDRTEPYAKDAPALAAAPAADAEAPEPAAAPTAPEALAAPAAPAAPAAAVDPAAQQAAFKAAIAAAAAAAQAAAAQAHAQAKKTGQAPMPPQEPGGPYFVKVSAQSNVKQVAGKVAHTCRSGDAPAMLCIGTACINQGVKAISVARGAPPDLM